MYPLRLPGTRPSVGRRIPASPRRFRPPFRPARIVLSKAGSRRETTTPPPQRVAREFEATISDLRASAVQLRTRLLKRIELEFDRAGEELFGNSEELLVPAPEGSPSDWALPAPGGNSSPGLRERGRQPETSAEPSESTPSSVQVPGLDSQILSLLSVEGEGPEPATPPTEGDLYEGTVRLSVKVNESVRRVLHFVDELCQKPQVRLLRLVGNHNEGLELWVGLREPLPLQQLLGSMRGVDHVSEVPAGDSKKEERQLEVWFMETPAARAA